jgi:hypothetical protein
VSQIPREAREGLMRAWLEILRERHPGVLWVALSGDEGVRETKGDELNNSSALVATIRR